MEGGPEMQKNVTVAIPTEKRCEGNSVHVQLEIQILQENITVSYLLEFAAVGRQFVPVLPQSFFFQTSQLHSWLAVWPIQRTTALDRQL